MATHPPSKETPAQTTTKPQELNVIQSQRKEFQFTQQKTSQLDRGYLKKKKNSVLFNSPSL